jgi:hypothetical protein
MIFTLKRTPLKDLANDLRLRQREWALAERRRFGWYNKFGLEAHKFFKDEAVSIPSAFLDNGILGLSNYFDSEQTELAEILRSLYNAIGEDFGKQAYDNLIKGYDNYNYKDFNPFSFDVVFSQLWSAIRATLIVETSRELANRIITDGIADNLSTYQISRGLRGFYLDEVNYRSMLTARTEVVMSSNSAMNYGVEQTGYRNIVKTWCSAADDRVRDSHINIDGETVKMDEKFSNGLEYPGDPNGDASEVIQCRCVAGYTMA